MFEFALSCGEGTLLDYGVTDDRDFMAMHLSYCEPYRYRFRPSGDFEAIGHNTLSFRAASPDCMTGQ